MKLNNAWAIIADKIEFVFSYNHANTTPLKKFTVMCYMSGYEQQ